MTLTTIKKAGLDALALDHVFTIGASGSSAYTFQGEGLNGTVNNPTLYLTRGKTYRFENGSGGHPIRIQSTSGASGTAYNTGVTNNAGSGTVIVEVQHDAPDVLYYQCTSHANMNGVLYITGALADGGVTTAKIADDAVNGNKIADGAVGGAAILDNAIGTAKIQDNAITLAKLPHGDGSSDGKFLRANNGADPTFETVSTDLVNDTSPQLGGDLQSNGNNIDFGDSGGASDDRAVFGADSDMQLYHTGSQGVLDNDTGALDINTTSDLRLNVQSIFKVLTKGGSENCIIGNTDGSVELYHNNTRKFLTDSNGVYVNAGSLYIDTDNEFIALGNSNDFKLYHNGTNSIIENATGALVVKPEGLMRIQDRTTDEVRADFVDNGEVSLYHNNIKKIETTSTGIKITGETEAGGGATSGNIQMVNGGRKNTIGNSFSSSSTESRIEFGVSDGSTSGGTNRVASISYAGIAFGTDTASANRLDDYEEGTYTPTFTNGVASGLTYNVQEGYYRKIGTLVEFTFYIQFGTGSNDTNGGRLIVSLPFTQNSSSYLRGHGNITYHNIASASPNSDPPSLYIYGSGADAYSSNGADFTGGNGSNQATRYYIGGGHFYST